MWSVLTFLSLQFPTESPFALAFLYSQSLWFNPTGHQGQNEGKSGKWQVIGRESKKETEVHCLVIYNSASWLWDKAKMLPSEGRRGQRKLPDHNTSFFHWLGFLMSLTNLPGSKNPEEMCLQNREPIRFDKALGNTCMPVC